MSALIEDYLAGLHRWLPATVAAEAADGLIETYEHHLAAGTGASPHRHPLRDAAVPRNCSERPGTPTGRRRAVARRAPRRLGAAR